MTTKKKCFTLYAILIASLFGGIYSDIDLHSQTIQNTSGLKNVEKIKEVIDFTLGILSGDIIKIEKKFKKDIPMWNVEMNIASGGNLEFEVSVNDSKLMQIDADEGPFDYDVNPGEEFIPLSSARKTAEEFTSQKIKKWKLKQDKTKFEYNFWLFTKTGKAQVRVDAMTGEIITKRKSKKK